MENLTKDGHNKTFLSKNWALFLIFKKGQGSPPPPHSCALVSLAEYASISLNIPRYP